MLKVNMNIERNTFIFCLLVTTLIAGCIVYERYDLGFRDEQIYISIIIVYFISFCVVTPLIVAMLKNRTIDEERKKYIMNILNIDDELAESYIKEVLSPTIDYPPYILVKTLSGRKYVLTKQDEENLKTEKDQFLFLLTLIKTKNKYRLYNSEFEDKRIQNFLKENKKIYKFFS